MWFGAGNVCVSGVADTLPNQFTNRICEGHKDLSRCKAAKPFCVVRLAIMIFMSLSQFMAVWLIRKVHSVVLQAVTVLSTLKGRRSLSVVRQVMTLYLKEARAQGERVWGHCYTKPVFYPCSSRGKFKGHENLLAKDEPAGTTKGQPWTRGAAVVSAKFIAERFRP